MSTNGTNRPTKLHISTQAVTRLLKERDYYHKEVEGERATVARQRAALQEKISSGVTPDENEEYLIDQRERAIKETEAVLGPLRGKIEKATSALEDALSTADGATPEELEKAKKAIEDAKAALSA
ncbi:hypothetical protein VUR80DRAFT_2578 [Thermomyces stellatus]